MISTWDLVEVLGYVPAGAQSRVADACCGPVVYCAVPRTYLRVEPCLSVPVHVRRVLHASTPFPLLYNSTTSSLHYVMRRPE